MNIHETESYAKIIDILDARGLSYTIAGGYPRDLMYGRTPKDMDICIVKASMEDKYYLMKTLEENKWMEKEFDIKPEYSDRRIDKVFKTNIDIDFIFWCDAQSTDEVLSSFDYNINQFEFYYNPNLSDEPTPLTITFHGDKLGTLTRIRDDEDADMQCRLQRIEKIEGYAKEMGWEIPAIGYVAAVPEWIDSNPTI